MQSHASRHVVSDHLRHRMPDFSEPFLSDIVADEIALAFGRRAIPKLVDILALPDGVLSSCRELAHALRVFNAELTNQETKADAIACEAGWHLVRNAKSADAEVQMLSCRGLQALATTMVGRYHVIRVGAVEVMVEVLGECPEGAAGCLAQVAQGNEGLQAILSSPAKVVAAVAEVVLRRDVAPKALESASVMMERVMQLDEGIMQALAAHVPAALLTVLDRATTGALAGTAGRGMRVAALEGLAQAAHHEYGRAQIMEPFPGERPPVDTSLQVMLRCLQLGDHAALRGLTRCLMGLTVDPYNKREVADHCLSTLMKWLTNAQSLLDEGKADLETLENCRDVVENCAEHPVVEARLRETLAPGTFQELLGRPRPLSAGATGR